MTKNNEKKQSPKIASERTTQERVRKEHNARPSERGLGPDGGGWNIKQASEWSGIGEASLRDRAKRGLIPCYKIGRRILIPRAGFQRWFNEQTGAAA